MTAPTLKRLDLAAMLKTPPPSLDWVAEGLVVAGGVTLLSGEPGVGKSMLGMALGVRVAGGGKSSTTRQQPALVMYVDAENGMDEAHRRVHGLGLRADDAGLFHYLIATEHDMIRDRDEIVAYARRERPRLIVLDSLRSLWRGDENDSRSAAQVMETAVALARNSGAGVLVLHHVSKNTASSYRGSTAFGAAVEIVATIRRAGDASPDEMAVTLAVDKCRCAPRPADRRLVINCSDGALEVRDGRDRVAPVRDDLLKVLMEVLPSDPHRMSQNDACRVIGRPEGDRSLRKALKLLQSGGIADRDDAGWFLTEGGVSSAQTPTPSVGTPLMDTEISPEGWVRW